MSQPRRKPNRSRRSQTRRPDPIEFWRTGPGLGDDVQVLKAGTMEIADLFVVNKADRDGVEKCVIEIEQLLGAREMDESTFLPPIVPVVARDNQGIVELAEAIGHLV